MEVQNNDSLGSLSENARREAQLKNEDQPAAEVPEIGQDSLNRVTKLPEAYDLSGSLSEENQNPSTCQQPGEVPESVDNIDDAGIDCTREPDWEVVKPIESAFSDP